MNIGEGGEVGDEKKIVEELNSTGLVSLLQHRLIRVNLHWLMERRGMRAVVLFDLTMNFFVFMLMLGKFFSTLLASKRTTEQGQMLWMGDGIGCVILIGDKYFVNGNDAFDGREINHVDTQTVDVRLRKRARVDKYMCVCRRIYGVNRNKSLEH